MEAMQTDAASKTVKAPFHATIIGLGMTAKCSNITPDLPNAVRKYAEPSTTAANHISLAVGCGPTIACFS